MKMLVSFFFKRVQYGYKMVVLGVKMETTDQTSCLQLPNERGVMVPELYFQPSVSSLLFPITSGLMLENIFSMLFFTKQKMY